MCDNKSSNPFAGLFTTNSNDATFPSNQSAELNVKRPNESISDNDTFDQKIQAEENHSLSDYDPEDAEREELFDELIADVFGITLHHRKKKKPVRQLVFIGEKSVEPAIFERLLLTQPESMLISKESTKGQDLDSHVIQNKIVPYLFESYCRLQRYRLSDGSLDSVENIRKIILRDMGTALEEPEVFKDQEVHIQLIDLFKDAEIVGAELSSFIGGIVEILCLENEGYETDVIRTAFGPVLDIIQQETADSQLFVLKSHWFFILQTFAKFVPLAKLVISHSTVNKNNGQAYSNTLLGNLLSISCLPKLDYQPFPIFDKPFQQQSPSMDGNIWSALDTLNESMHIIFRSLLKYSREVRHLTLQWIADCLHANVSRGKLWNLHNEMDLPNVLTVSDGFMLNLGNVLLRLCQPFCDNLQPNDVRILKVDPTYCAATIKSESDSRERGLHMKDIHSETCLIPTPEGESRPVATSFNFVTECFYLTHRALDLGYRIALEKTLKISQNLARIQRMYTESRLNESTEINELISQRLETEMTKYLSYRACLLNPELLTLLAKFHAATAFWLMQVNVDTRSDEKKQESYAPIEYKPITFPLPKTVPNVLRCIPEFVIENIVNYIRFLQRWSPNIFEEQGPNFLHHVLTVLVALMESPARLYNPHLRARLAEGLEALLPHNEVVDQRTASQTLGTFHRKQLFEIHQHKDIIVPNLLSVFVCIEMSGQSVELEQKFNYRRPMYIVMEYLWKIPEHRNNFKLLAQYAEANMEAVQPPLFLRFINLLINDAVYSLDHALSNMAELKQLIAARNSGDWDKLSHEEREQQTNNLERIGNIARFYNILGKKTMETLKMLTTEIKSIFCHPTMVSRIVEMLNYRLWELVGPNKKNLKVKDQDEYEFKPADLVLNICKIYINLSQNDNFILAVSQDGRSYNPELFKIASEVLVRIGGGIILADLEPFAKKVEQAALQKKEEDESLNDIPDDFLDPIMSTLMIDPVILPTSKAVVDRQTIARHLLSDQTDPFNRSPLTMDMVKSDDNLKKKIHEWMEQKKKEREASTSNSQ